MARKTNYAFERNSRAKAKAAKREAKRQAKLDKKAEGLDADGLEEDPDQVQVAEEAQPPVEAP